MASKDPSNIDKNIDYKLKLKRVDSGMSQEALGENVGLSSQQIQKYKKVRTGFQHLACLNSHVFSKLTSLISLRGMKHPDLISEWRTVPPFQNFLFLSAAMKV